MLGVSLGPVNSVVHLSEALSGSDLPSRRAHWLLRASFVLFGRRVGGAGWKRWREGFAGERRRDCQLCSASSSKVGSCWSECSQHSRSGCFSESDALPGGLGLLLSALWRPRAVGRRQGSYAATQALLWSVLQHFLFSSRKKRKEERKGAPRSFTRAPM